MKIIIILITLLYSFTSNAQMFGQAFKGDCNSSDPTERANFIFYMNNSYDSLYKYSSVLLCEGDVEQRKINKTFRYITFNNVNYYMKDLFAHVVYQNLDTNLNLHEYVIELDNSNDSVVAVDYGSKEYVSTDSSIDFYRSYFLQVDYVDTYGSSYSSSDTNEVNVFYESPTHFLKKIIDIDRSKVVGLHYYSDANNKEYIYFFEANN